MILRISQFLLTVTFLTGILSYKFDCKIESLKMCRCIDEMSAEKSDAQSCSSTELNSDSLSVKKKKFIVDCSNAGLKFVPKQIPIKVTHLYLDDNNITSLGGGSFEQKLPNLLFLSAENNGISKIGNNAFKYLPHLRELDLFNNSINRVTNLVFISLSKTLEKVDIGMNFKQDKAVSQQYLTSIAKLSHLGELRMDIIKNRSLPEEYGQMKHLQKLSFMEGGRYIKLIPNDMFDSVKLLNITEVYLIGLQLDIIGKETFFKTPNLRVLDLSNNPRLGIHLPDIATSLKNTSIQALRLNNTGIGSTYQSSTDVIYHFCGLHLKELILDHNSIREMKPIFRKCFPRLEILSLADNYLVETVWLTLDTVNLRYLVGLNYSSQSRPSSNVPSDSVHKRVKRFKWKAHACEKHMACPIILSPQLEWIDISRTGIKVQQIPELSLMQNSSLKYFKASYTGIESVQFPFYCPYNVIPKVETIDISNSALRCINESVFDPNIGHCDWSSLKYFYLGNNKLGNTFENTCNKNKQNILGFIKHLTGLEVLDISQNMIETSYSLTPLSNLSNLKLLDLSSNLLHNFSLDLNNLNGLLNLKLNNNNLKYLSQKTTKQLDMLQASGQNSSCLKVDLSGNFFSCQCAYLNFLNWMTKTNVILINKKNYQCEFNDGVTTKVNNIQFAIAKLESQCYSSIWLKVYLSSQCLVYFLISVISLLYRFRHDIKYLFLKLKLNRHKLRHLLNPGEYTYSAFVSCDRSDCLFVKQKLLFNLETEETRLKFCVAQRNFVVGVTIIDNIMRAIDKSEKVICIISKAFVKSGWCKEELRLAHQVSLERGENIIICIFMPDIKQDELPSTLRIITKQVTCLKWCPDPKVQKVFWLKLQSGLVEGDKNINERSVIV